MVRPSCSPYSSPIVVVQKRDGSICLCVDYRQLNAKTPKDAYPLPRIEESLDALTGTNWFLLLTWLVGITKFRCLKGTNKKLPFVPPLVFLNTIRCLLDCAMHLVLSSGSWSGFLEINTSNPFCCTWMPIYKMAPLCSEAIQVAPLRLCFYLLFYLLLLSLFTHITSALITYDKGTLLDIGHHYTNLFQVTLSTNSSWPLEILWNAEENNGHRRRIKKHCGKRTGIRNRLRKRAHSPPLPSILLANVQSLENKMDDLRARISFQRDIRDCNIICLTETWLTPSVPDTAVTPSDNFSVLRPVNPKVEECVS